MNFKSTDITVVMCTSERLVLAAEFIDYFCECFPENRLIVIENSRTGENYQKLRMEFGSRKNLVIDRSTPAGLSRARNLGKSLVQTSLVAFTDDDCKPDKEWLNELALSPLWKSVSAIGGRIEGLMPFEFNKDDLSNDLLTALALLDLGDSRKTLDDTESIFGANMCFKLTSISEINFDEDLGRKGQSLLSGEDVEFVAQLRQRGGLIGYEPSALVRHKVSMDRLNPAWFLKRFAWQGVSDASTDGIDFSRWNLDALNYHASRLGIRPAIDKLLEPTMSSIDDRSKLIRYFVYHVLNLSNDNCVSTYIPDFSYYPPLKPNLQNILFDYEGYHDFLGNTLNKEKFTFYISSLQPWEMSFSECKSEIDNLIKLQLSSKISLRIVVLTLDNLLSDNYFKYFRNLIGTQSRVTGFLHRTPRGEYLRNLQIIQSQIDILTFSKHIHKNLKEMGIQSRYTPLPGRYSKFPKINLPRTSGAKFKVAIPGELRSIKQLKYIQDLLEYATLNTEEVELHVIGGVKSMEIYNTLLELKRRFKALINIEKVKKIDKYFRVISDRSYQVSIESCDVVFKMQFEEFEAASAVVSDCISLNVPVLALANTEAANMISDFSPELVVPNFSPSSFFKIINSINLESYSNIREIAIIRNKQFEMDLLNVD